MTTPLLACNAFSIDPETERLIMGVVILWFVAVLTAIPNLLMSLRRGNSRSYAVGNVIFFTVYLFLGWLLFSGAAFQGNGLSGLVLIFVVPAMSAGHFIFLFRGWRRERKARLAGAKTADGSATKTDATN